MLRIQDIRLKFLLLVFAVLWVPSLYYAIKYNTFMLYGIPLAFGGVILVAADYRLLFWGLLLAIPFSSEIGLGESLQLDVPVEPMLVGMATLATLFAVARQGIDKDFWRHPLVLILLLQIIWMFCTSIQSTQPSSTVKYIIQKWWLLSAGILFPYAILRQEKDFKRMYKVFATALLLVVGYVMIGHAFTGFAWDTINPSSYPFYINHVMYGCSIAMGVPVVWALHKWKNKRGKLILYVFLLAVVLSYARASWASVLALPLVAFVVRKKLMPLAIPIVVIGLSLAVNFIITQNRYLNFAPNYKKTVMHDDLGSHLSATMEGQDVSSMERVYRWIAAKRMIEANPVMGLGPDSFYPEYFKYTVETFRTYVSDNPERSTTHNYYLMLATEQGIPATILFVLGLVYFFVRASQLYHRYESAFYRQLLMSMIFIMFVFVFHLLLNDLVETNKVGLWYYFLLGMLIRLDVLYRANKKVDALSPSSKSRPASAG